MRLVSVAPLGNRYVTVLSEMRTTRALPALTIPMAFFDGEGISGVTPDRCFPVGAVKVLIAVTMIFLAGCAIVGDPLFNEQRAARLAEVKKPDEPEGLTFG